MSNFTLTMNSSSNASDLDPDQVRAILYQMDDEFAFTILAAIIYMGVVLICGFIGNLLVFIVYMRKFKANTTRIFVFAMAAINLVGCCLAMPGEILDMRRNFSFDNVAMCKVARMVNHFYSIGSGLVLIAVAVDRYKKICRPHNIQITPHGAKRAVLYSLLASALISWPAAVLYGKRSVETRVPGVTGTDCSMADIFLKTPFPLVYNGVLFLVFLGSTVTIITLYCFMWKQVKTQCKFRSNVTQGQTSTTRKTTFMLFLITLVFVLSYLPHLALMAVKAVNTAMVEELQGGAKAAYNLFLRSYFLQSAANPLIYSFCNVQFRTECKGLFSGASVPAKEYSASGEL